MGSGASTLIPESETDALAAGYTQKQIATYRVGLYLWSNSLPPGRRHRLPVRGTIRLGPLFDIATHTNIFVLGAHQSLWPSHASRNAATIQASPFGVPRVQDPPRCVCGDRRATGKECNHQPPHSPISSFLRPFDVRVEYFHHRT